MTWRLSACEALTAKSTSLPVEHRKRAGHSEADGTDVGVWLGAEDVGAGAEDLGFGEKLHMHFETDDRFVLGQNVHRIFRRDRHMEIDYNGWRGGQWSRRADKS